MISVVVAVASVRIYAKLFLIKLQQEDGRGYSSIKTIHGVLRPVFQMTVDDDIIMKNPFEFELAGIIVDDSETREAISRDQMKQFLKFVHEMLCTVSIMKLFISFFILE